VALGTAGTTGGGAAGAAGWFLANNATGLVAVGGSGGLTVGGGGAGGNAAACYGDTVYRGGNGGASGTSNSGGGGGGAGSTGQGKDANGDIAGGNTTEYGGAGGAGLSGSGPGNVGLNCGGGGGGARGSQVGGAGAQGLIRITYTAAISAPTVTTSAASSIGATTATLNGDVTATGGENATVTVYWGTSDGGTTPGSWANNGTPTSPSQPQGVASFYKDVSGLSPGTPYYFNAKATNTGGTGWGTSRNFTTPAVYNLTMTEAPGGSGTATDLTNASPYTAGTVVNITAAAAAAGYKFANWTAPAGVFGNAIAAATNFTMPSQNVTVTANFEPVVATALELLPESDSNPVNTTHDLTATVRDQFNNVMTGVAVTWNITGVGSFSGTPEGTTDGSGEADAVITSSVPGTSTVRCEVTSNSSVYDTATKDWTYGAEAATLDLSPKTGSNPVNTTHDLTATVRDQFNNVMTGSGCDLEHNRCGLLLGHS